jgi:MFS family permease
MIAAVALFGIGSIISGTAPSSTVLLFGRIVQGTGGAGIALLTHIIIGDLVPLRERSKFMSIIFAVFMVGTALGPLTGGVLVQHTSWRWIFYINLPVACIAMSLLYLFLQVQPPKGLASERRLVRIDIFGTILLMASVTSTLIGLSYGGSRYPWSSWCVLVAVILGLSGTFLFYMYEASRFCTEPVLPPRILKSNRTTTIALVLSFNQFLLSYWILYFMPVYFQRVLLVSPESSGILLLPTVLSSVPLAVLFGYLLTRTGRYKPIHIIATGLLTLGLGLFIRLDASFEIVIFQCIAAAGFGILMSTLVPAVQAGLSEVDAGVGTATWGFLRANGGIWGVAIPGAIFNSQFQRYLEERIHEQNVVATLGKGSAYAHVSGSYIQKLPPMLRQEVIGVYVDALQVVWAVSAVFSGLSFLLCFLEVELPLRTTTQSK